MPLPQSGQHPNAVDMSPLEQLWREIRSNARDWVNDQNLNRPISLDVSAGGTIALTVDQQFAGSLIELTGSPGAGFTIQLFNGGEFSLLLENGADRMLLEDGTGNLLLDGSFENFQMIFLNSSGQTATIDTVSGAASPVVILAGDTVAVQTLGADIITIGIVGLETGALLQTGDVPPTAEINFADKELAKPLLRDYAFTVTAPSISAGVLTLDLQLGNYFDVDLDEDVTTLTLLNPLASEASTIVLFIKQDITGNWTIAWPASFEWEQDTGLSPSLTLDANAQDIFQLTTIDGGTTWQAIVVSLDSK